MIGDLFFVVKMLILTIIVVAIAQVKVGQKPIEEHFQGWLKTSMFVDSIQEAIDGGIALTKIGYKKADLGIHGLLARVHSHHSSSERSLHFTLKRHNEKEDDDELENLPRAKAPVARAPVL